MNKKIQLLHNLIVAIQTATKKRDARYNKQARELAQALARELTGRECTEDEVLLFADLLD